MANLIARAHRTVEVEGVTVFYRQPGSWSADEVNYGGRSARDHCHTAPVWLLTPVIKWQFKDILSNINLTDLLGRESVARATSMRSQSWGHGGGKHTRRPIGQRYDLGKL